MHQRGLQQIAPVFVGDGVAEELPLDVRPELADEGIERRSFAVDGAAKKLTINRECHGRVSFVSKTDAPLPRA